MSVYTVFLYELYKPDLSLVILKKISKEGFSQNIGFNSFKKRISLTIILKTFGDKRQAIFLCSFSIDISNLKDFLKILANISA